LLGSHLSSTATVGVKPALLAVCESLDGMSPVSQIQSIRRRQKCVNLQYSGSGKSPRAVMTDGFLQIYDGGAACVFTVGKVVCDYCTVQFTVFCIRKCVCRNSTTDVAGRSTTSTLHYSRRVSTSRRIGSIHQIGQNALFPRGYRSCSGEFALKHGMAFCKIGRAGWGKERTLNLGNTK
jgi:hypothetical protein